MGAVVSVMQSSPAAILAAELGWTHILVSEECLFDWLGSTWAAEVEELRGHCSRRTADVVLA